jgi:HNH endonuclease
MENALLTLELPLAIPSPVRRVTPGAVDLPIDDDTEARFRVKCTPYPDDRGHLWWLGATDGRNDSSGGYGRFQAGGGENAVICIAHRMAWTLAHDPVPEGLIVRHRCDEPLCVALPHLELGTALDNRWDALDRPLRAAELDTRGSAGRSRAIRAAVRDFLTRGVVDPVALGIAVREAMALGDPDRFQLSLWMADEREDRTAGVN